MIDTFFKSYLSYLFLW